jgi:hypothetical protein
MRYGLKGQPFPQLLICKNSQNSLHTQTITLNRYLLIGCHMFTIQGCVRCGGAGVDRTHYFKLPLSMSEIIAID